MTDLYVCLRPIRVRVCMCESDVVILGCAASVEVEKFDLKTKVEGNLKKQSKTKPGKVVANDSN